jgi:hypothetical protein
VARGIDVVEPDLNSGFKYFRLIQWSSPKNYFDSHR